jgi:4-amino-4-deoxy-L-arabinose transferase-like glycosyltransferase
LQRLYRKEWLVVTGIGALALLLRLVALGQVPPGVRYDELVNVKMAGHIYAGEWPIYFQEAWGHEPLYHYVHALGMRLFGRTILGVRITSVLFGTLGVLSTYLVFRHLFGRGAATLAALLLATSFWSLMYSRIGLRHISLPPWIGLGAYCFWRGLEAPREARRQVAGWFALAGVVLGASLYTYFASRVVPLIFVATALYLLAFHCDMVRGRAWGVATALALPLLLVTPMAAYLIRHPELEQRLGQVSGGLLGAAQAGDPVRAFWTVLRTFGMFSLHGDPEWLYNIAGRPVLDASASFAFAVGLGTTLWHWRDPRRAFLLLWLLLGIAPSLLSWPPGSLGHTIVAQPATFGVTALGWVDAWHWIERRQSRRLRVGTRSLLLLIPLLFAGLNAYDYYARWPRYPEVRHEYQASSTAVARYLEQHPEATPAYVSAPYVDYWNPWSKMNFDLYAGAAGAAVRWFDGQQSLVLPGGHKGYVYVTEQALPSSGLAPAFAALLERGAVPVRDGSLSAADGTLRAYRWRDNRAVDALLAEAAQAPAWASAETAYVAGTSEAQRVPLAMPLDYGRLALLGYSYGDEARAGEAWQVTTYWRVLQADAAPLAVFVHVLDDANAVRASWDGFHVAPAGLREGDLVIHVHAIALPDDLPAGEWRVELGVYSPVTLERLPLTIDSGEMPPVGASDQRAFFERAPYDRALLRDLVVKQITE